MQAEIQEVPSMAKSGPPLPKWTWVLAAVFAAFLVFWNLGHYGLWDDEADTALFGQTVWQTGDMDCRLGKNIITIFDGMTMVNYKQRYMPPLQYYVVAPFVGLFPSNALAARLPFAVCGFALILTMLHVSRRHGVDRLSESLATVSILASVPTFLFVRQCRYYALAMLATTVVLYLHYTFSGRRRQLLLLGVSLWALLASQYMGFAAVCGVLTVDLCLERWCVGTWKYSRRQIIAVTLPVALAGLPIILICNPLQRLGSDVTSSMLGLTMRLDAIRLYFLEANNNGIYAITVLLAGIFIAVTRRDVLLYRTVIAITVYTFVIAMLAKGASGGVVDIADRYLVPLLPLSTFVIARVIWQAWRIRASIGLAVAGLLLLTNFASLEWIRGSIRCYIAEYVAELVSPPTANITALVTFVRDHIPAGATIDVRRSHHLYPLIFHAPEYVYTGQLPPEKRELFPDLPVVHFRGECDPDFLVRSGPDEWDASDGLTLNDGQTCHFTWVGVVPTYIISTYRPTQSTRLYYRSPSIVCKNAEDMIHVYARTR